MSKIWDALRDLERGKIESARKSIEPVHDHRCGPRVWTYAPVFVYGRTIEDEPFYEPTEVLRVNASGGLITLTTTVSLRHPLLLINKVNHKEQKCRVVGYRGSYGNRNAVGFELSEPAPDFWVGGQ
jgi:hypothetical protein